MTNKITTLVGITGKQGASIADVFLQEGGWHVRGVTAIQPTAFAGSTVAFGVADFWGIVADPESQKRAQESGRPVNVLAYDLEVQQVRNIVDASLPGNPDAPVSQVIARHDTGSFVKALTQVEPGKRLPGASGFLSWNEYAALWGKVHCVQCSFPPLDRKVIENAIPSGVVEELADMYEYIGDFANHGDPSLRIGAPFWTIEEFIRQEGWSSIL
ncbi:hypothetical protein TrVGV298_010990 [Trichoderma virens]|nr:hypothetical protein TrVGV298_010990 [Trichoderma virens]